MATGTDVINFVKPHIKNMPLTGVDLILVNQTLAIIHMAYPWRWTLSDLTPVTLVDGTQDYTITDNAYFRLITAEIARTDCTPNIHRDLDIVKYLGKELNLKGGLEQIRKVAPLQATKVRLDKAVSVASPVVLKFQGQYQFEPVKITGLGDTLPIEDHYLHVVIEGLLWRLYKYADDSRAGSIQIVKNGGVVFTGQMGVFYALLNDMKVIEDAGSGDSVIFPAEGSLGAFEYGSTSWPY